MPLKRSIGVVVNISLDDLTAHPIFCLQLAHHLCSFGDVTLYLPGRAETIDVKELQKRTGFSIDFRIRFVRDRWFGKRSLRLFYYFSVMKLWRDGKNLLWAFEPYSIKFATALGLASVMEIHSSLPTKRYIDCSLEIQSSSKFKVFIANSRAHCDLLRSRGFLTSKLLGAHNAIAENWLVHGAASSEASSFWGRFGIREGFIATYAGSLYRGRGVELILDVAPALPEVAFVVLGGPEARRKELQGQCRSSNVYFLGQIAHREVQSFLVASNVLIALYTIDCEDIGGNKTILTASPMKLFEYMASGVPVITSNVGAIPEIVEDGVTGMLIDPEDAGAFSGAIKALMENGDLANKISKAALERITRYTWPARLNSIFEVLDAA